MKDPAVLYVEDHAHSRLIVQMTLKQRMKLSRVIILEDSSTFADHIKTVEPPYDLVLLDIHMKPFDGFEMLEKLRKLPVYEKTPVIALTASVMSEEVKRLEEVGFDGVISKPIDIDTFPHIVERILAGERIWTIVE